MDIISRNHLTAAEWDTLVNASPDGWVFSLWGWQELIEAVEAWALEDYSFAIRQGRRLMAVVPLHYHPGSSCMVSSGWGGSGPVIDGRLNGKSRHNLMRLAIQHCINLAKERHAARFEIPLSPVTATSISSAWGVNPLAFYGLVDRSGLAQVVDLFKSENELWAELSADARRQIKIARNSGIRIERVDWPGHANHYYKLHVATYTRTGVTPHPHSYFEGIAAHTALSGNSVLWAAYQSDGEIIAYHNSTWFNGGASYHTGCSAHDARSSSATYLLFWEAMLGAKRAGIHWYDCGAIFPGPTASEKQKGLSTFKTKFGGQPHRQFSADLTFSLHDAASATVATSVSTFSQRFIRSLAYRLRAFKRSGE